eukprot:3956498-Lingulodinium_polyedra.AAC.1
MEQLCCVGIATPLNVEYKLFALPGSTQFSWLQQTFARKNAILLCNDQRILHPTASAIGNTWLSPSA